MQQSVASVRRFHPEARIICYTDKMGQDLISDPHIDVRLLEVTARETDWHDPRFKVSAILNASTSPFIFLDNDTYVAGGLSAAWNLLKSYDLMAVTAPIKDQRKAKNLTKLNVYDSIPDDCAEINTGVLFVNSSSRCLECLKRWVDLLELNPGELGDQWRMRIALFECEPILYRLPPNYNFRTSTPQALRGAIKIFHGHENQFERIAERLNASNEFRDIYKVGNSLRAFPIHDGNLLGKLKILARRFTR